MLPTDPPIPGVSAQNVPGWTSKVTTQKLSTPLKTDDGEISDVVSDVTWTATSAATGIQPEAFQGFDILVGALPEKGSEVVFKAVQTYANGDEVKWVDPVTEGGPAAEHPTPILALTTDKGSATTTPITIASGGSATGPVATAQDDADTAKTIGIVAIIFSVVALAGVAFSLARKRSAGSS